MINAEFSLRRNELAFKSGLLFAGHFNGQISLISGKGKIAKFVEFISFLTSKRREVTRGVVHLKQKEGSTAQFKMF